MATNRSETNRSKSTERGAAATRAGAASAVAARGATLPKVASSLNARGFVEASADRSEAQASAPVVPQFQGRGPGSPRPYQQRAHHIVAAGEDIAVGLGQIAEAATIRNTRRGDATARAGLRAVTRAYARLFCNALPDADPQVIESLVALCSTETARALAARREANAAPPTAGDAQG